MTTEPTAESPRDRYLLTLSLAALGVVYGDIGTSPLYAIRECFYGEYGVPVSPANVLGVLSLIVWSLVVVVSIKYLVFVMRADNRLVLLHLEHGLQRAERVKNILRKV